MIGQCEAQHRAGRDPHQTLHRSLLVCRSECMSISFGLVSNTYSQTAEVDNIAPVTAEPFAAKFKTSTSG
jgi:hypothetical protein